MAFHIAFDEVCKMVVPIEYQASEYWKQVNFLTDEIIIYKP
jgi:hypothetical protein